MLNHCVYETVENAYHNFVEPKVASINCFFCPSNTPKFKDSSFTGKNDKGKHNMSVGADAHSFPSW